MLVFIYISNILLIPWLRYLTFFIHVFQDSEKANQQFEQDLKALQAKLTEESKQREQRQKEADDLEKLHAAMVKAR